MFKKTPLLLVVLALGVSSACGRPTEPSSTTVDRFAIMAPASASADLGTMFTESGAADWADARSRLRGFQFYQQSLRDFCATCGPNTISRFLNARPGGAFAWLTSEGIQVGVEAGAVKEHTCDGRRTGEMVINDMAPIYGTGSHVTFIAMDEPFTAALPLSEPGAGPRCNFDIDQTVREVKNFIDTVHAQYPGIRIGLIEPYPFFTVDQITGFLVALENAGVRLPFFRLDFDLRHRKNADTNSSADLKKLRSYLSGRGIDFELIVTGYDGKTDAGAVASAMALAYEVRGAVGRPHAVSFQDWSSDRNGTGTSAVNLPERQVGSLAWLVNNGVDVFR
jgi:hypothetical protein